MRPRKTRNQKRRITGDLSDLDAAKGLAEKVSYGGNPEHKKEPGDFNLSPPNRPRQGKSLCDGVRIFRREEALELLREGLRRGLVSDQKRNGWPQNVWAVTPDGTPLEAQLENQSTGVYHGYPLPENDPMAAEVLRRWKKR